jgi:uncharacterized delta-60 repeat protein
MNAFLTRCCLYLCSLAPLTKLCAQYPTPDDFNPVVDAPGWDPSVDAVAVQADGNIVAGGMFTLLGGEPYQNIGRLNPGGSLDSGFNPQADGEVYSLAIQADGKILVSGVFRSLAGGPYSFIARLNSDGTLDTAFDVGSDAPAFAIAIQADGKILVGGYFTTLCGQTRNHIARLNLDGTLDNTFNPGADGPPPPSVRTIAVQPDGKILVGGYFSTLGGQTRNCIGRLNADGTLDTSFKPSANSYVFAIAVQADGKILAGGYFTSLGGQTRNHIGRLNSDGSLDTTFDPDCEDAVYAIVLQTDERIVLGGGFLAISGQDRWGLGRVNADGSLDSTFDPRAGSACLAMQADGKILVGGHFTRLGSQLRSRLGRLNNTEPATQQLIIRDSDVLWLRSGTSPEIWRCTFDYSTNVLDWLPLGEGSRVLGGWQVANTSIPAGAVLRARGFVPQSSNWVIESMTTNVPPLDPPRVDCVLGSNGQPTLVLYGRLGTKCSIQSRTSLETGDWTDMATALTLTNASLSIPLPESRGRQGFFRACAN